MKLQSGQVKVSYSSEKLVSTLSAEPNKRFCRALSYFFLVAVAFADTRFGASPWVAYAGVVVIGCLASYALPSRETASTARLRIAAVVDRPYFWPVRYQLAVAILAFVAIEALDHHVGGFRLGRIFNIYCAAVFFHALIFGLRSSLLIWFLAVLTTYFAEVPPEYSFKLQTIEDFAAVITFTYLGFLSLASAHLLRISSIAGARLGERR